VTCRVLKRCSCSSWLALSAQDTCCAMSTQVCVLSVITSIIRFALPLAGRCRPCDAQDPDHCVSGRRLGTNQWFKFAFYNVIDVL
jgi:hypothetical protein